MPTDGCCTPSGCLRPGESIIVARHSADDGDDNLAIAANTAVRVICNNAECAMSGLMHRQCFDVWEMSVLHYLRSCGRARSWSEKQRHQNLWTKKGYDLAFKACGCLCGRGHLRKDTDWPPVKKVAETEQLQQQGAPQQGQARRRRGSNKNAVKLLVQPVTTTSTTSKAPNNNNTSNTAAHHLMMITNQMRNRANSLSSTGSTASSSGSSSPPDVMIPPGQSGQVFFSQTAVNNKPMTKRPVKLEDRERLGSGNSGLFAHRSDFSSFNALPRHKLNSYHIKMEDEGSYGNDDIRCFILSNLATAKMAKTFCIVCQRAMQIFDRYPLIDGTFFLSPKQYSKACIPVTVEGRQQHLSAVCMSCLEGWDCSLRCRSCRTPWNGSSLILGTMYSYDVFAAVPCCPDRLRCNQCNGLVVQPDHRYQYFSQYSRDLSCPHCSSHEHHFVKPLPSVFQLFRHDKQQTN